MAADIALSGFVLLWLGGAIAMILMTVLAEMDYGWTAPAEELFWFVFFDLIWPISLPCAMWLGSGEP